jgi:ubiquinone/menaquinone biosynthesis C-methylase UbiE
VVDAEQRWRDHYNRIAGQYDLKESLWALLLGYSMAQERRRLVGSLELKPGQRVLEVSTGTGDSFVLVAASLGSEGRAVGADISIEMLRQCRKKLERKHLGANLVESDAEHLPFRDDAFDAVLHFGAITLFGDEKAAIDEMVRVAKPGARVVIGDVGVSPRRRGSLRGKVAVWVNARYGEEPPMQFVAQHASEARLTWFRNETCYLIDFAKPRR